MPTRKCMTLFPLLYLRCEDIRKAIPHRDTSFTQACTRSGDTSLDALAGHKLAHAQGPRDMQQTGKISN
ncbi:hypothetical protein PCASD_26542, partial [Puccinia coronata f. sp. avenae]